MSILPHRTQPPRLKIDRIHQPEAASGRYGYRAYRSCLRWEFGFTCSFCLLHEADWGIDGTESLGLMTIEHLVPVSVRSEYVNEYRNCFYACRLCNVARSNKPSVSFDGSQLLDPCRHGWADHFYTTDDGRLLPREGDLNALYTSSTYDLNDERKVNLRQIRAERILELLEAIQSGQEMGQKLQVLCFLEESDRSLILLEAALLLHTNVLAALDDLRRYAAVPNDTDPVCRCGRDDHHALPLWLAEQTSPLPG